MRFGGDLYTRAAMKRMPMVRALALVAIGSAVVIAVVVAVVWAFQRPDPFVEVGLSRPAPGEARADYLPDGTPVWVMGHDDGTVSVLSGFDTHTPLNLNKLNWWCRTSDAIENPAHGSKWDEYGVKIDGPAPTAAALRGCARSNRPTPFIRSNASSGVALTN